MKQEKKALWELDTVSWPQTIYKMYYVKGVQWNANFSNLLIYKQKLVQKNQMNIKFTYSLPRAVSIIASNTWMKGAYCESTSTFIWQFSIQYCSREFIILDQELGSK